MRKTGERNSCGKRGGKAALLAALMALLMPVMITAPAAAGQEDVRPEIVEGTAEPVTELKVGVTTPLSGCFFTDMWGRRTSDIDIRLLLHSCNLVRWNGAEGRFEPDPSVVRGLSVMQNPEGDRSYVFTLTEDMYFSDGRQITAWDYAFSLLFSISPEIRALDGIPEDKSYILGCEEYLAGEKSMLTGVRVLADDMLMITVRHESFPFFFELGLLSCIPCPIRTIAPGVTVRDDGEGVYLANEIEDADGDQIPDPPLYTAGLLKETLLDPQSGYLAHPSVVSGPYLLESWDGTTATFSRNEYYKDYTGYYLHYEADGMLGEVLSPEQYEARKTAAEDSFYPEEYRFVPYIEKLTVTYVEEEKAIGNLLSGEIDLINKVTSSDTIQEGILTMRDARAAALMRQEKEGGDAAEEEEIREITMANYPRTGLGFISFACEREELSLAVRQAMALCMDRDAVVRDYTGGFGLRVDSYYGIGQWMYNMVEGNTVPPVDPPEDENDAAAQADYEEQLAAWNALSLENLNSYPLDPDAANELLEADGWIRNEKTGIREKKIPLQAAEEAVDPAEETVDPAEETVDPAEETGASTEAAQAETQTDEVSEELFRTVRLDLTLAYPKDIQIAETLEVNWIPYLEQAGIQLKLLPMNFEELLGLYYGWTDRSGDAPSLFFLGSNFDVLFDPLVYFGEAKEAEQPDEAGDFNIKEAEQPDEAEDFNIEENGTETVPGNMTWEYTQLYDPELYRLAADMRSTEPGQILEYLQKWIRFQERFNELLPILPLYSNVYFDFYVSDLHDYRVAESLSWSSCITEAELYRLEKAPDENTEEDGDEPETSDEDDTAVFEEESTAEGETIIFEEEIRP